MSPGGPGADGDPPERGQRLPVGGRASTGQRARVNNVAAGEPHRVHDDLQGGYQQTPLTLYARAPVANATTGCNNPATNTGGAATGAVHGRPDELSPRIVALRPDAQHRQHPHLESRPGRLLRDRSAQWSRLPGEAARLGHPPTSCRGPGTTPLPADPNDVTHNATDPSARSGTWIPRLARSGQGRSERGGLNAAPLVLHAQRPGRVSLPRPRGAPGTGFVAPGLLSVGGRGPVAGASAVSAPERSRTSTGLAAHKALNLARLPVPPQARVAVDSRRPPGPLASVRGTS